ncbi:cytochrome c1 [Afifella pfennigii]|uniref:cytochrome c1 n=1 Tax=Afifella pfennigii TaxID=209897 RepID=UPI00047A5636|nr:cytochrome c1 [Afifella pfennigii]
MFKLITRLSAAAAFVIAGLGMTTVSARAAEGFPIKKPEEVEWSFAGPFGTYDQQQLQRGFQIYREVCAACHSLDLVPFRALGWEGGPNFSEEAVKQLASEYMITDGPDEFGDMFERAGQPYDYFPSPFPNDKAAAFANNGVAPPDLSVMAKARGVTRGFPTFVFDLFTAYQENGPDYVHALLTGYEDPPEDMEVRPGQYYNPYYLYAATLAMPPPLFDDMITYAQNEDDNPDNDVPQTVDQYSRDVSAFLMWAAEPHMETRKSMGFSVLAFLIILTGLTYYTKRKVWANVEH